MNGNYKIALYGQSLFNGNDDTANKKYASAIANSDFNIVRRGVK
jgi:hypothetical protein